MSNPLVVTYRHAYVEGETSLCTACDQDEAVQQQLPSLGSVSHAAHRGHCDGCAIRGRRAEASS